MAASVSAFGIVVLFVSLVIGLRIVWFEGPMDFFGNVTLEDKTHNAPGHHHNHNHQTTSSSVSPVTCPMQPDIRDVGNNWDPFADPSFRDVAYKRLAGAVQIATESYDDMPLDPTGPQFDVFRRLQEYLQTTFPTFHSTLDLEHVNTHGMLFTWQGSDRSLKPIILMAHQDVVPVNPSTLDQWTYGPYSAHLDQEGWIWGRGTTDMKSTLISLFSSTEMLIQEGFQPERTILYSFGFDEEIGGERGAKHLAAHILQRYGPNGASLVVDEGFTGVDNEYGQKFARVGLAEKGCLTVKLTVNSMGGHSSAPPKHTGIGIMARMLVEMENNTRVAALQEGNPLLSYLACAATHGDMSEEIKAKIRDPRDWALLAEELSSDGAMDVFMKTTQAVSVINGGIKFNALPETVTSLTNYRIDFFERSQDVIDRLSKLLIPVAQSLNMSFSVIGDSPPPSSNSQNSIILETFGILIEPAPMTPDTGPAFDLMGGTIKHLFPGAVVVPSAMTAFTDTQYYWDITPHIYRFLPASLSQVKNYHTVNERIHIDAHLSTIGFFYKLIQNTAGWQSP